jgi:hypothetical protein
LIEGNFDWEFHFNSAGSGEFDDALLGLRPSLYAIVRSADYNSRDRKLLWRHSWRTDLIALLLSNLAAFE